MLFCLFVFRFACLFVEVKGKEQGNTRLKSVNRWVVVMLVCQCELQICWEAESAHDSCVHIEITHF